MWLLLITPEAEPLVGDWRAKHDDSARFGIPAHVTVRTPFLPPERWRDPKLSLLESFLPTEVTLSRLEDRPGGLVILVEPDEALREMTEAVSLQWPTLPPHKGNRSDLAYHITVVRTASDSIRTQAWEAIAPNLPLKAAGTELWASAGSLEEGLQHVVLVRTPHQGPSK